MENVNSGAENATKEKEAEVAGYNRTTAILGVLAMLFVSCGIGILIGKSSTPTTTKTSASKATTTSANGTLNVSDGFTVEGYRINDLVFAEVTKQQGANANKLNPFRVRIYGWREMGHAEGNPYLELCMLQTWEVGGNITPQEAIERYKAMTSEPNDLVAGK
jgi:hypothetical protein